MSDLRLAVKQEYFDQIKSGKKTEEYRLMTDYWKKRLVGRTYDTVTITSGYPKKGDKEREITRPWRGYKEKTITHPHFDNKPEDVFAIQLVERTQPAHTEGKNG